MSSKAERDKAERDDILTIDDLSTWLQLKKHYIYALTSQGRIPCLKIGRHLRFRRSEIEQWLFDHSKERFLIETS